MIDAYLAGLFDGEGCVTYKQYLERRNNRPNKTRVWRIRLEISMTDLKTIEAAHQMFGCGTTRPKHVKEGRLPQWRWTCSHRDALYCSKGMVPFSITKKEKLLNIIKHYEIKDSRSI